METLKAYRAGSEYHFVLGELDGYGWCVWNEDTGELITGGLDRAADGEQATYDALAAAIDKMTDAEFLAMCKGARDERANRDDEPEAFDPNANRYKWPEDRRR